MKKNIPAFIITGVFFFCAWATATPLELALDLFEKEQWALCKRECSRARLAGTEPKERFQLLSALSALHLNKSSTEVLAQLEKIITEARSKPTTALAAYEAGRLYWQVDQPRQALNAFSGAFFSANDKSLFLRSACSMFLLFKEYPDLKAGREDLVAQINTSRSQWYGALFKTCAKPSSQNQTAATPNWIVRFYRSQISPAIGNRCVLEPSCSEYFNQAHHKHGFKAFPMMADRFFREPDVSNTQEDPVVMPSGQIRYRDPLENHDFWMKK